MVHLHVPPLGHRYAGFVSKTAAKPPLRCATQATENVPSKSEQMVQETAKTGQKTPPFLPIMPILLLDLIVFGSQKPPPLLTLIARNSLIRNWLMTLSCWQPP